MMLWVAFLCCEQGVALAFCEFIDTHLFSSDALLEQSNIHEKSHGFPVFGEDTTLGFDLVICSVFVPSESRPIDLIYSEVDSTHV